MTKTLLFIGIGGGIGSMARYLCQRWLTTSFLQPFPWGTLAVNLTGCLLIGIFWGISIKSPGSNDNWKVFLMTGLCGGFTTFSAFTLESIDLLKQQKSGLFFVYVAGSVLVGLAATYAGLKLTRSI